MRNLLDTHVALWFLNGDNVPEKVRELIKNGDNYISVASLWETAIKMNLGKYTFDGGFEVLRKAVRDNGFKVLPIKDEYMVKLFDLPLIHRDPFDRLIISTSLVEDMTIITKDDDIQKYDVLWVW
jgi:PIN domain nuclease of toxin-antitoxin system